MKTSSAKAKGRRAAKELKEMLLRHAGPVIEDGDIVVTSSGDTGEDLKLSPRARRVYPMTFEVKNVERLNVREAYKQACSHEKNYIPVLAHTKNRSEMLITLRAEDFLALFMEGSQHGRKQVGGIH